MGEKRETKTILRLVCDKCGREEVNGKPLNMVYRCMGCGKDNCTWCMMKNDYNPLHVTTDGKDYGKVLFACEECRKNPPGPQKTTFAILERIKAFDEETDELEEQRARERKRIIDTLGDVKNKNCIVSVERKEDEW